MQYGAMTVRSVESRRRGKPPCTAAKRPPTRGRPAAPEPGTFRWRSKSVEYGADDANARIAQLPDDAGRIGKTGVVFAGEHHDVACPESHVLRIRAELRRRRVEEDDVELGPHFLQENAELRARQQLLRIGRGRAGRQERKPPEFPDGRDRAAIGAAGEDR